MRHAMLLSLYYNNFAYKFWLYLQKNEDALNFTYLHENEDSIK